MAKKESFINPLSPGQFVDIFGAGLSEDDKKSIVETIEHNTHIDADDIQRFRAILDPFEGVNLKGKAVKTCQMTCKTWDLSSLTDVVTGEQEFDKDGNLIYRKDIFDSIYSKEYFDIENEDDLENSERIVKQSFDEHAHLLEKQVTENGIPFIERFTYDAEGRELSQTRVFYDGSEYHRDFFYHLNEEGYCWKECKSSTDEDYFSRVTAKDGTVLYDVVEEINHDEQVFTCYQYQYDEQGRLTCVCSYVVDKAADTGRSRVFEYLEEDGKKKTITRIYIMSPLDENADLLDNTENWQISEEPIEQYTLSEWVEGGNNWSLMRDDLTGKEEKTIEFFDDNGCLYKRIQSEWENDLMISRSVYLFDNQGHIIDILSSHDERIFWHTVNHYSDDGLLLFSSHTYIPRGGISAHSRQVLCWYEYTFFEK